MLQIEIIERDTYESKDDFLKRVNNFLVYISSRGYEWDHVEYFEDKGIFKSIAIAYETEE